VANADDYHSRVNTRGSWDSPQQLRSNTDSLGEREEESRRRRERARDRKKEREKARVRESKHFFPLLAPNRQHGG
jgi:hypothetical protein